MPSSHLILCRPLLLLPPILPSIKVFTDESTLRMRWPKYWSFSFSSSPSKEQKYLMIKTKQTNKKNLCFSKKGKMSEGKCLNWRRLSLITIAALVCLLSLFSYIRLFETLWTISCQAPQSMGFSRKEYWSGLPCCRRSSQSWDRTCISCDSCIGRRVLYH